MFCFGILSKLLFVLSHFWNPIFSRAKSLKGINQMELFNHYLLWSLLHVPYLPLSSGYIFLPWLLSCLFFLIPFLRNSFPMVGSSFLPTSPLGLPQSLFFCSFSCLRSLVMGSTFSPSAITCILSIWSPGLPGATDPYIQLPTLTPGAPIAILGQH